MITKTERGSIDILWENISSFRRSEQYVQLPSPVTRIAWLLLEKNDLFSLKWL